MNSSVRRFVFILFTLGFISTNVPGQNYIVQKRLYTYSDGLPGNKVTCAVQDKLGFIWLGTPYGLCRFDGQKFQLFTPKTHGLQNKPIGALYSEPNGGVIIAYQETFSDVNISFDKLDVIDIYSLQVKSITDFYPRMPFGGNEIRNIYATRENVLIGFLVAPYEYASLKLRATCPLWVPDSNGVFTSRPRRVKKIVRFISNNGMDTAVCSDYSLQDNLNTADMILLEDHDLLLKSGNSLRYLYKDERGYVILRIESSGKQALYFFGYNGELQLLGYGTGTYGNYTFSVNNSYSNGYFGLSVDRQNFFSVFSYELGPVQVSDSTDSDAIKRAKPLHVICDRLGIFWICTTEGLLRVNIAPKYFQTWYSTDLEPKPGNQSARGILVNENFSVVALNSHFNIQYPDRTIRVESPFNHSALYHNNTLWLGSFDLMTFDFATEKTVFRIHSTSDEIWSIFPLTGKRLLLGCTNGLDIYDSVTNSISPVDVNGFPVPKLVYRIFTGPQQQIYCVADNGIFTVSREGRITDYLGQHAKPVDHQLPFEGINDLHIDQEGIYWFATAQQGLYRWDRNKNTFDNFGIDEGFLSAKLCRIEEDAAGNLWIGTDFGLACFNKNSRRAKVYTTEDGLPHNEFNRSSSFRDAKGNLYFGTIDGCTWFDPSSLSDQDHVNSFPFILTSLKKFNPATNLQEDVSVELHRKGFLELSGNSSNLSLSVLLLDMQDRVHLYMYEIEGLDKKRNYSYDGQINLSNLPYGTYTLVVNAQHSDGTWNSTPLKIELHVVPPFYQTGWFIALVIVVLIVAAFLYFRFRFKKINTEKIQLEKVVDERTKELRGSLAEQTALLQEVHHRVKNNLQFIAAMLQMQISSVTDEKNKAVLQETSLRINSMSLVHEMLYGKDKLEFISIDEYLGELISKLNEMVFVQHAPVEFRMNIAHVKFNVNDSVAIGMMTSEIISNSIKYAFTGIPHPAIEISLREDTVRKLIEFRISDNGNGIDPAKKGKGLGLRLIDIFSRQMEAEYRTINENGLTYIFEIPYRTDEQSI